LLDELCRLGRSRRARKPCNQQKEKKKKTKRKGKRTNQKWEKNESSRPKTKIQTPSLAISPSLPHKDFDGKIPNKPLPNSLMLFKSPNANPNPQELQLRIPDSPPSFRQTTLSQSQTQPKMRQAQPVSSGSDRRPCEN
jgi:hypothetical protein